MRNPLWILNLGLASLFILTLGIIFFTRKPLPARKTLTPQPVALSPKKTLSSIDLSRIYENDLFKTYIKPVRQVEPEKIDLAVPLPPMMKPAPLLQRPQVQFLDPLKINIKGIISVGDEKDDRVIIEDEKTRKEELYSVGDTIEDAEILKIDPTKVIFIRSNGQEEIMFLNAHEASLDPIFAHDTTWNNAVQKISSTSFAVNAEMIEEQIPSLADFIDMLDLTTALKNSVAVGCRVGMMNKDSIGHVLGLVYNDIITKINGMPVSSTKERVAVYQSLKKAALGSTIRVRIERNGNEIELLYVLKTGDNSIPIVVNNGAVKPQPINHITESPPPSLALMQRRDKIAMKQFGGRDALVQRT